MNYFVRVLVALDQFANAVLGGREDETLSSRIGRYDRTQPKSGAPSVGDLLDVVDPGHAEKAIEYDQYGRPDAHGLDDAPPGAARTPTHLFDPDPADPPHCVKCKAPSWHPVHGSGVTR